MLDIYILDERFLNKTLVEGYSSFIWTDRATEEGEFSAIFPENAPILSEIQELQFLGQNLSHKIMQVLTKKYKTDDNGYRICTVSGLSYEHVFRGRTLLGSHPYLYSWNGARNRSTSVEKDYLGNSLRTNVFGNPRFITKGLVKTGGYEPWATSTNGVYSVVLLNDSGGATITPVESGNGDTYIQIGSQDTLNSSIHHINFTKNTYVGILAYVKAEQAMVKTNSRAMSIYTYCIEGSTVTELTSSAADDTQDDWQKVTLVSRVRPSATGYLIRLYNGSKREEDKVNWDNLLIVFGSSEESVQKKLARGYFDGSSTAISLNSTITFPKFLSNETLAVENRYYSLKELIRSINNDPLDHLPYLTGVTLGSPDLPGYSASIAFEDSDEFTSTPKDVYTLLTSAAEYFGDNFGAFRKNNGDDAAFPPSGVTLHWYNGSNRTLSNWSDTITNPAVVFSQELGTLIGVEEVISVENSYTAVEVQGKYQSKIKEASGTQKLGYNRIVGIVDASSEIDTDKFDNRTEENLTTVAQLALAVPYRESILDGESSKSSGYVYEQDFGLGSEVSFIGRQGTVKTMIVTEYIFSQDDTGFSCYPTLTEKY